MANVRIDFDINLSKSADQSFKKWIKDTEKGLGNISKEMKKIDETFSTLFSGSKAKADAFIASLNKVDDIEGINTVIASLKGLKQALTDGSITTETYYTEVSKLTEQFARLAGQADVAGKKVQGVGTLSQKDISSLKTGTVTKTDVQNYDVPQLKQALTVLENQVVVEKLKGRALRENKDVQELIKRQLKDMNMSTQESITKKQKELDILKKQQEAQRKLNPQAQLSFAQGLSANSLNEIKTKIDQLNIAKRNMLQGTTEEQKAYREVNREIRDLEKRYKQLETAGTDLAKKNSHTSESFRKLGIMAASYFSVYAIKNFAKEVAMVTGEFDIQRRSLAALLQNKEAADAIFERIKQTALRSPFSVMELTTYTKQLAAYRVETEQLYDTTYRLADVSAGLGVDMGRLILAFGQVKAASVLRGTELRQFTEAGIPLIQLLAEKFTQLEGRVVSTGEVFDKISNRLVPFQMIDEIFKDMTKSGGAFYEMQKIQSETIKGRLVNLTDAYQLFLDKIGSSSVGGGLIKLFISSLESLLKNTEGITTTLITAISVFGAYKVALLLTGGATLKLIKFGEIWKGMQIAQLVITKQITKAQIEQTLAANKVTSGFAKMIATNPYAILAAAVAGLVAVIGMAIYNQDKFNREIKKIESEGLGEYNTLVRTYEKLAATIKDTTKSAQEQKDAYDQLKRTFKDILPDKLLEIDYLKKSADGYNAVRAAIYNKIKAQVDEQKLTKLQEQYKDVVQEREDMSVKGLMNLRKFSEEESRSIIERVKLRYDETKSIDEAIKTYQQLSGLTNFTKEQIYDDMNPVFSGIRTFLTEYANFDTKLTEITNSTFKGLSKSYAQFGTEFKQIGNKLQESLKQDFTIVADPKNAKVTASEFEKAYNSVINYYNKVIENARSKTIDPKDKNAIAQRDAFTKQLQSDLDAFVAEAESKRSMIKIISTIASEYKIGSATMMKYLKDDNMGDEEWLKSKEEVLNERNAFIERYKNSIPSVQAEMVKTVGQNIDLYTRETNALKELIEKYGFREKVNKASNKNPLLDAIKEEISLIETLTKRYDELRKAGSTTPKEDAAKEYAENIQEVQKILDKQGITFDFEAYIGDKEVLKKALKAQYDSFAKNTSVQKELSEALGKPGIDIKVNNLEQVQKDIEKSLKDLQQKREFSIELNEAPRGTRDILMAMFGFTDADLVTSMQDFSQKANAIISKGLSDAKIETSITDFTQLTREQFAAIFSQIKDSDIAKSLLDVFDFVRKEQIDFIKNTSSSYNKLLESFDEYQQQIITIQQNTQKELELLDDQYYISKKAKDEAYNRTRDAILKRQANNISKVLFDELKNSDLFSSIFENLEKSSVESLEYIYKQLKKFEQGAGKDLDLKQYKELIKTLENIKTQIDKRNPFKALRTSVKDYSAAQNEIEIATEEFKVAQEQYDAITSNYVSSTEEKERATKAYEDALKKLYKVQNDAQNAAYTFNKALDDTMGYVKGVGGILSDATGFIFDMADAFGFLSDESEKAKKSIEDLIGGQMTALDGVAQIIGGAYTDNVGMIISGIANAAVGTYQSILAVIELSKQNNDAGDIIRVTTREIDFLTGSIERLNSAVDDMIGSDWIKMMQEISDREAQIAADLQKNIDAEKSRKDPDESLIKDWESQLYDAEQASKDAIEAIAEELMGGSIKDLAEELGDTFVSAFMRGEDAINEMKETFNKMIQNMIVKSIVSSIISKRLEAITNMLDASLKDNVLSPDEILDMTNLSNEVLAGITADMEGIKPFLDNVRRMLGITGEVGDTLQKGIKGVTEQTASAIESYLNTLRYEVFKHTNLLTSIARDVSLSRDIQSSILIQAQQHYQVALAIKQLIESVTINNGSGQGFRVYSY